MVELSTLNDKLKEYLPKKVLPFIQEGYEFAFKCHDGQLRKSGEPFLEHPLQTAIIIA